MHRLTELQSSVKCLYPNIVHVQQKKVFFLKLRGILQARHCSREVFQLALVDDYWWLNIFICMFNVLVILAICIMALCYPSVVT